MPGTPAASRSSHSAAARISPDPAVPNRAAGVDRPHRRCRALDRVVAVVDRLDLQHRLRPRRGVVARPLTERPFGHGQFLRRGHEAFVDKLGVVRERHAGDAAFHQLDGPADAPARHVELADVFRRETGRGRAQRRRLPDRHHHRAMLAPRPPFLADGIGVLAGLDEQRQRFLVPDGHAVGAGIDPARVRVLRDHHAFGADIGAAVARVPFRRRKGQHIDLIVHQHVLEHGAVADVLGRDRLRALAPVLAIVLHQFKAHPVVEHAGRAHIDHDAVVVRVPLDLAEQQHRRHRLLQRQLVERAHFQMGVGAFDDLQLADLLGDGQAPAQVGERGEALLLIDGFAHWIAAAGCVGLSRRDSRTPPPTRAIQIPSTAHGPTNRRFCRRTGAGRADKKFPPIGQ